MNAGKDLNLKASELNAVGYVTLDAGHDINATAVANEQHDESNDKKHTFANTIVTNSLAGITSGSAVTVKADNDATLIGTNITSAGDTSINAKRDTNISAVVDSEYHYSKDTDKKSLGRSKTTINETLNETLAGGTIDSGGDLLINAHKNADGKVIGDESSNVNLAGVSLTAKKDVAIAADDDVNITGMHYNTLDYHQTKKSGALGLSKKDQGSVESDTHLQNASIKADGNAHILSGSDLTLAATNVVVNGNIDLQVVDNLLVTAGEAISNSEEWSKKSGVMSGGDLYRKTEHKAGEGITEAQASNLVAGGSVTAQAGTGQVIGSNIRGDQGVKLASDAGDLDILAATTTTQAYSHDKTLSVGIGDLGKAISRPDQMVKNQDGRATVKIADAQFDSVDDKSKATDMQGSSIESKQNVTLLASAGSVNVKGSTLAADTDSNQDGTLGLAGTTGVSITEATNTFESETKKVHGSAELSVVVQHQAVEVVKAIKAVDDAKDQLEKAKKEFKAYERNLDQLEAQLGQLESDYANKVPGVSYDDLLELREIIRDSKDDKEWYQAGVALAAVNLTTSITALVQQTQAAAASAGTYGFNAGLQLDVDASKSTAKNNSTTAQASNLSGNNILIQTGTANQDGTLNRANTTTTIQGSHLAATNQIDIQTGELNLLNSKDTTEQKNETEHGHVTAQMTVYGAAGGASVSGSFDRSKDSNTTTTVNNTTLNADKINLDTTGDTNIRGANVHADSALLVDVGGDLNVESQQNRSRSKNNSVGISGGFSLGGANNEPTLDQAINGNAFTNNVRGPSNVGSTSGVNGGVSASNGMSVTRETVLTSLTSGGTADITVKGNTQITGALIATIDNKGNDLGKLDLTTGSLSFTDLRNISQNSQTSGGISSNFGMGDIKADQDNPRAGQTTAEGANGETLHARTSNLTYNNQQTNSGSKTLATLGHGNITVGGTALEQNGELTEAGKAAPSLIALNRDTSTTEKELWNSEQSQTVDASLDHRLLSKDGLNDIKKDVSKVYNGVASYFSDIDPTIKAQTGETGSRAYDALRRQGLSDKEANTLLGDPALVDILSRLDDAETALAQGDNGSKAPSKETTSPAEPNEDPSKLPPGVLPTVVVKGESLEQTATEDAVLALNDLKNYIGKTRETNPKTATALETGISLATGGAVVTAVGKGIEYGLDKSGMGEEVAKQVSKVTDPIIEAGANGIERYDLSNEEFHTAVVEEGQEGNAASLKGGTGFFISSVLGVGGALGVGKAASGPYNPINTRKDLEATYGAENVKSTTVPNDPHQRVNSNPDKGVEVIYGENGGKAVKVTYVDPKTGQELQANIPYNDRGLPVFDDVAKFTTDIDKTKSYTAQMSQATRDLREGIKSGQIDPGQFTAQQLDDINRGRRTITDYTWHHNADSNNMQLIPKAVHDGASHVGQHSLDEGK